ncbi:PepSY domain-containing protein [Diaphorobacter nitroreducens]|uniref:PepSY domain-containing protein n=1 Tax=Diaphorobacter nitroreducens TaxID=164759 RepID=UPI00289E3DE7|nr:PepSY domain-containing protein [Diaphorobacter nitroreducens]
MVWRQIHRWLGLVAGALALVLGITGTLLALDPLRNAWQAASPAQDLPVATLVQRIQASVPGAEEIRHLPSGGIVVHAFDNGQAQALRVDPADGRVLGGYEPSLLPRWVKNLHRSLLLGDAGRMTAAVVALAMLVLSVSGLVLLLRRMGGWRQLAGPVRGTLAQRLHVLAGRVILLVLAVSAAAALVMSAATFGLLPLDAVAEPDVASVQGSQAALRADQLPLLQELRVQDLRKLNLPAADDPQDTWRVITAQGQGWVDRYSGQTLAWQDATAAQRVHDWALLLHTGEGAWVWALVLGVMGASIPLFWITGVVLWWQARRSRPRMANNSPLAQADSLVFVASEGGTTWGFAQALHAALVATGQRVHTTALEHWRVPPTARQVYVLAATYGDGQPPAHAARALDAITRQPVTGAQVTVLGFGDRQFPAFCAYAEALEQALRAQGWPSLLPLERIHQQSAQEFARWGRALSQALGLRLQIDYQPRLPRTVALTLAARQDFPGGAGEPAAILRFALPARGLPRFAAGDLIGIVAPGQAVPRYYSLASGTRDGFVEICVRHMPGGVCSSHLHALQAGDSVQAFIRSNPGFVLPAGRAPVLLIGAGTGVAPLAGFIRDNTRHRPMHLYYGARHPERDFYFGTELQSWQADGRLAGLHTTFSRTPGGGYVQEILRRDATQVLALIAQGALVRVCGSRAMAQGVAQVLDALLGPQGQSLAQLKEQGRYAEDLF